MDCNLKVNDNLDLFEEKEVLYFFKVQNYKISEVQKDIRKEVYPKEEKIQNYSDYNTNVLTKRDVATKDNLIDKEVKVVSLNVESYAHNLALFTIQEIKHCRRREGFIRKY